MNKRQHQLFTGSNKALLASVAYLTEVWLA